MQKQLTAMNGLGECRIGTLLIPGGSPGHAMIIVDIAQDAEGKKTYRLAQGYMPAQDIQIVINPGDSYLNPWYYLGNGRLKHRVGFPAGCFRRIQLNDYE